MEGRYDTPKVKERLAQLQFFLLLNEQQQMEFAAHVNFRELRKGEKLQQLGKDYGGCIHLITKGLVSIRKYSVNGERIASLPLGVDDFCSFEYIVGEGVSNYEIMTLTPVSIAAVPVQFFKKLIGSNQAALEFIISGTRTILGDMLNHRSIFALSRPRIRVITFLLYLSKKAGDPSEDGSRPVPEWLTQTELALMAGTTRETVCATFKALQQDGGLVTEGKRLRLGMAFYEKYKVSV
ncbi:Crp/Fnr family transcriptional regulator [Liquorilactobacillus satsumensis]|uniref:HTH crp-type domain-containing protein n=3 Tax=Liquorilactobacillus satsumensis TaxID=259059 RepID=A0A0R1V234_9LACO|nr:Crp/Fnr family transcriptional regulator [Liquorilactobacillus satsumensis]KRL99695.1 hypothetical protein FD50_GL000009 [Liquorilactobacillus satsumensis DSM 16230 = JCM 12392]MCP9313624.1 Crp/Fnr family transcriptional regulator [Liquorilactobacillus satsumensis]MCP9328288.1 Crp/Fnr family transcriptional regulator [Liquorilactobacillus satsumensis]MCP9360758.1 Crp/Fnr family transcriptional regulator [Liquorilactobacillus satsumensis]